jgi:hypothetical protein
MRAVVLWRDPRAREGQALNEAEQGEYNAWHRSMQQAARDSGRVFLGGRSGNRSWSASFTRRTPPGGATDSLFVADGKFALPRSDSAIVVMVELSTDTPARARVLETAWIPAGVAPDYDSKAFNDVLGRPQGEAAVLRKVLARAPLVLKFLNRAP